MKLYNYSLLKESLRTARTRYLETNKISLDRFNQFIEADPSKTKKYLEWMCKINTEFGYAASIIKTVKLFDKAIKTKFKLPSKDINYYKSKDDLVGLVHLLEDFKIYQSQTKSNIKQQGATKIYENDMCSIYYIKDREACRLYGSNTKWCITMDTSKYWDEYSLEYLFFFILPKTKRKKNSKVALLIKNKQFAEEQLDYPLNDIQAFNSADNDISQILKDRVFDYYNINFLQFKKAIINKVDFKEVFVNKQKEFLEYYGLERNEDGSYNILKDGKKSNKMVFVLPPSMVNQSKGELTINFKKSYRSFDCSYLHLTSLKGCPQIIDGSFVCSQNSELTSLVGGPKKVTGSYFCVRTSLTSLKGCAQEIGNKSSDLNVLDVTRNETLTSLEGCPQTIYGNFDCQKNPKLKSLIGGPRKVTGDYYCSETSITSLEGCAKEIGKKLYITGISTLTSLKGAPTKIGNSSWFELETLENLENLKGLENTKGITSLTIAYTPNLTSLEGIPKQIKHISLFHVPKLKNLKGLEGMVLEKLDIERVLGLTTFEGAPKSIKILRVNYMDINDFKGLENCNISNLLYSNGCMHLQSLMGLPKKFNGTLNILAPNLTDLTGFPKKVMGDVSISNVSRKYKSLEPLYNTTIKGEFFIDIDPYALSTSELEFIKEKTKGEIDINN